MARENREEEIISIPSTRGKAPKEISMKNLAAIIQARMEEIIEHIYYEIRNSGYEKKLIEGIVLTGGGAQLKHIAQLTEFMTGMETRIGYPNEHLAPENPVEMASPMYATGIGLVIEGIDRYQKEANSHSPAIQELIQATPENPVPTTPPSRKFLNSFLNKIKNIFEEDVQ
jgi:cell division protein FtsA